MRNRISEVTQVRQTEERATRGTGGLQESPEYWSTHVVRRPPEDEGTIRKVRGSSAGTQRVKNSTCHSNQTGNSH